MGRFLGSIAPMRSADFILFPSLEEVKPSLVIADGRVVATGGCLLEPIEQLEAPRSMVESIHIRRVPTPVDFAVKAPVERGNLNVRAIGVTGGSVGTKEVIDGLNVEEGRVQISTSKDLLKVAVVERHHASGRKAVAFTKGFGFEDGAVASTVAHNSHNLLVVGAREKDMAFAAQKVIKGGGGMIAVRGGRVLGRIELPVAGLLSNRPVEEVAEQAGGLLEAWRGLV